MKEIIKALVIIIITVLVLIYNIKVVKIEKNLVTIDVIGFEFLYEVEE